MDSPIVSCHEDLTALDTLIPPTYIRFLILLNTPDGTSSLARLKTGTRRLVSEFPFLAGYVFTGPAPGDPNSGCHIIPPPSDADLVIAAVQTISESYRNVYPGGQAHPALDTAHLPLQPIADIANPSPIFRLQITLFSDGVGLGFALHHNVMDAIGAGTVVKALGSCCCGAGPGTDIGLDLDTLTPLQYSARVSLNKLTQGAHNLELDRSRYGLQPHPGPIMFDLDGLKRLPPPSAFTLSATKIQDLKSHLNTLIGQSASLQKQFGPASWISTNDTLVALIWLCYNRAKRRSEPPPSTTQPSAINPGLCMAANIRTRVHPPLPSNFLGNAAVPVKPALDSQPLLSAIGHASLFTDAVVPQRLRDDALCQIALAVRQSVSRVNSDYTRDISSLAQNSKVPLIYEYNPDTNISSWRDSAVYDAFFGDELGFPVDVYLHVPAVGYFIVAPKRREPDDSWEILAVLHPTTAACLRDDAIWSSVLSHSPSSRE